MPVSPANLPLYEAVTGKLVTTIDDVLATMLSIDALLPENDGLKWFNRLYMTVTREIDLAPPAGGWKDPAWLLRLDVVFASLYFHAIAAHLSGEPTPQSWNALFAARLTPGIDRIQFAMAGMNAHINHDLALALNLTGDATHVKPSIGSPQHTDFESVNLLLNALMPATLTMLATDTLGVAAQDTGKPGRLLAFWNMCAARDLAWAFAAHLRVLPGALQAITLSNQDQMTGVLGRAILLAV